MKIYTYCIIDSSESIDNTIKGIGGNGIHTIPFRDIGIVSSIVNSQIEPLLYSENLAISDSADIGKHSETFILQHEEVIEKLMDHFTVLPFRFRTIFNKEDEVISLMQQHYHGFKKNLERLHDKVEFGIKVLWNGNAIREEIESACRRIKQTNPSLTGTSSPKEYMNQQFEKYQIEKHIQQEADKWISIIDGILSKFADEKKYEKLKTIKLLLNAYYLVNKKNELNFKKSFDELKLTHKNLNYLFSGPWPAYNFIQFNETPLF